MFEKSISEAMLGKVLEAERALNRQEPYSLTSKTEALSVLQAIRKLDEGAANDDYGTRCTNILRRVCPIGRLEGTLDEIMGTLPEAIADCEKKLAKEDLRADQAHQFVYSLRVLAEQAQFKKRQEFECIIDELEPTLDAYAAL